MRKSHIKKVFRLVTVCCVISVVIFVPFLLLETFFDEETSGLRNGVNWRELVFSSTSERTYVIDSSRCQIALEDPLPPEWRIKLFDEEQRLQCNHPHNKNALFEVEIIAQRSCPILRIDILRREYNLSTEQILCEYFDVAKIHARTADQILLEMVFGVGTRLKFGDCPFVEEMWIVCQMPDNVEYRQPLMLPRLRGFDLRRRSARNAFHVMVLEVDSVSRLSFKRTMPKTQSTLEVLFGERLIQLYGYNKVGDNPATMQIPLFTGNPLLPDDAKDLQFDNWTRFVWQDFKERGYRTMFLEELPSQGLFEYPDYPGFAHPPTDYHSSRFLATVERAYKRQNCVFKRPVAKILLDYAHNLMRLLTRNRSLFSYVRLSRLTSTNLAGGLLLDDALTEFFNQMDASGTLSNTVVFFISDHGCSVSKFSISAQGRHEEMLPFAFILLPADFVQNRGVLMNTLVVNMYRLTTTLDIFATLVDIATDGSSFGKNRTSYGVSLISTEVPLDRSCDQAGIFGAYCSCYQGRAMISSTLESWFRQLLVERINYMLDEDLERNCARYSAPVTIGFDQIYEGRMPLNKFRLRVRMSPPAEFEGLFEKHGKSAQLEFVERLDVDFNRGCNNLSRNEQLCYCG